MIRRWLVVLALIVSVSGCGHESGAPTSPSGSSVTASAVVVSGTAPFVGTTAQFVATATLSNSGSQSVTTQAAWSSSNTTIATVSNDGTVTGVAAGDVDITATYQNVAGHAHVTITSVPNYQGFWAGDYSATACDGVGLCDPLGLGVGSVHSIYMNLTQNGTTVTGYMSLGIGLGLGQPMLSGWVDGNGHLVLSGTWSCFCGIGGTISDFDALVAGSSMSGHWTMTFTSVLSTGPRGTGQVVFQNFTRHTPNT